MNKNTLFSIGLLITGSCAASSLLAGEEIDLTQSAAPDGLVKINSVRGDVSIVGWDKDQISIVGELDDLAKELIFEVNGDRAVIKVVMPGGSVNWGDGSDLDIRVPKGSRVDFVGISTDTVAENILGGVRINSVSGDIKSSNLQGHLMLSAVSGRIVIEDCKGRLRSSSVIGDVDVLSHIGEIDLETGSGDVEIQLVENRNLRIKSISGKIDVVSDLMSGALVDIQSISGEIELELSGDIGAEFDINAGRSGNINNDLSEDEVFKTRNGRETLKMMLGDGSAQVRIKTVSANIKLE
ncbi:MAG: hypothetical protein ACI9VI_000026 [Candidatus Azotimanducaceae bacterium]|jgi:hypothetical protein